MILDHQQQRDHGIFTLDHPLLARIIYKAQHPPVQPPPAPPATSAMTRTTSTSAPLPTLGSGLLSLLGNHHGHAFSDTDQHPRY